MATTDSNGIVFLEETDPISPFHTTINTLQQGTSDAITGIEEDIEGLKEGDDGILVVHQVADVTERAALAATYSPTASKPLYVDRQDAPEGLNLERTSNGTTWRTVPSYDDDSDTWHTLGANGFGSLSSGTTSYTASPWSGVRVRRHRGVLYVSGAAVRTSWSDGNGIGTLPEGYRPSVHAQGYRCQLSTSGSLSWYGGSASGAQSFSLVIPL
jgi:hypothetical protein